MLPYEDRRRVLLWARESLILTEKQDILKPSLVDHIRSTLSLEWSDNMATTLGQARYSKKEKSSRIKLSTILWEAAPENQKRETVYHEMAHIIVDVRRENDPILSKVRRNRRDIHGDQWRYVMHKLGYPDAKRCHSVVNEDHERSRGKSKFRCSCPDKTYWLSLKKHILRDYKCTKCKTRLVLIGK